MRHASIFGFEAALDHDTIPSKATLADETMYPEVFSKTKLCL